MSVFPFLPDGKDRNPRPAPGHSLVRCVFQGMPYSRHAGGRRHHRRRDRRVEHRIPLGSYRTGRRRGRCRARSDLRARRDDPVERRHPPAVQPAREYRDGKPRPRGSIGASPIRWRSAARGRRFDSGARAISSSPMPAARRRWRGTSHFRSAWGSKSSCLPPVRSRAGFRRSHPGGSISPCSPTTTPGSTPTPRSWAFDARLARSGARYVAGEVIGFDADSIAVRAARLRDGAAVTAETFVNACGAWCAGIGKMVGLDLPVEPMSRESCFLHCADTIEPLPFLKTETDLAFRPEGEGYVGGVPDWSELPGWNFDISPTYFEEVVWPALARRIPAMERVRLQRSWRGHYARSTLDYSPILGRWEGGLDNFVLANGFSGHGIMHAPATGRGIAELIVDGGYQTIDRSLVLLVPSHSRGAPISRAGDRLTWGREGRAAVSGSSGSGAPSSRGRLRRRFGAAPRRLAPRSRRDGPDRVRRRRSW